MTDSRHDDEQVGTPWSGVRYSRVRLDSRGRLWFRGVEHGSWVPSETTAVCDTADHDAPAPGCGCGLWFAPDTATLAAATAETPRACVVEVSTWGRTVDASPGEAAGWRAEHLRVGAVTSPGPAGCHRCDSTADRVRSDDGILVAVCTRCDPDAPRRSEVEGMNAVTVRFDPAAPPVPAMSSVRRTRWWEPVVAVAALASMLFVITDVNNIDVDGFAVTVLTPAAAAVAAVMTVAAAAATVAMVVLRSRRGVAGGGIGAVMLLTLLWAAVSLMIVHDTPDRSAEAFAGVYDLEIVGHPLDGAPYTVRMVSADDVVCDVAFTWTEPVAMVASADCLDALIDAE